MSMIFSFSKKILSHVGFWCSAVILLVNTSVHAEEITYYHLDALGSTVAATDENGVLLWKEAYRPYGERIRKEDGDTNELWYTGKPHEEAMGLSYFGARWYDPTIGRFMAIDPVEVREGDIHNFNRYAYANNNPYKFVDPDGREALYGVSRDLAALQGRDMAAFDAGQEKVTRVMLGGLAVIAATIISEGTLGPTAAAVLMAGTTGDAPLPTHTRHGLNQKITRQVKTSDELSAIRNPLDVRPVKYDSQGRPSQRSIGENAEVVINPESNKVVSVNPTSSKKAAKLQEVNQ